MKMLKPIQMQSGDVKRDIAVAFEYLRQLQKEYNHDIEQLKQELIEVKNNGNS